jgi:hypothetical protein
MSSRIDLTCVRCGDSGVVPLNDESDPLTYERPCPKCALKNDNAPASVPGDGERPGH